jgi:CheY-like chemotaxis protein
MSTDHNPAQNGSAVPRLLVIDDDVIQRTIIAKIGTQAGYETASAASFAEAAQLLSQQGFDCVTLDLSLGKDSGVVLLDKMVETNNRVPIIIVSGAEEHIVNSTLKISQSLGLDSQILNKPLKLAELREALAQKREGWVARRGINRHYQLVGNGAGA